MINAFYTGTSGIQAQQKSIDVSANNIANVNSTGFKGERLDFTDLLYTNMAPGKKPAAADGHGVRPRKTVTAFIQGSLESTGRPLDLAIEGNGFFAVRDAKGQIAYTRAGNFSLSCQNGENYLTDSAGNYVLDQNGGRISCSGSDLNIAKMVGLFAFQNNDGLEALGDGRYRSAALAGPAVKAHGQVRQGYLEASSVDIAEELTGMLEAERAFQFNTKTVQMADEIEQMTNNLRG